MAPYPKITTYPPLGQLTILSPEQEHISITLVIEWDHSRPAYPFEICLAFVKASKTSHQSQWQTKTLDRSPHTTINLLNSKDSQRAVYIGVLSRQDFAIDANHPGHCLFTIKFRVDQHAPWQLLSVLDGTEPGELVFQQPIATFGSDISLLKCINLADGWNAKVAETPNSTTSARSFILESQSTIPAAEGSAFAISPLAFIPSSVRYFAVVRLEPFWLGPRQGKGSFFHLGEDSIVASFLLDNGLILTFVVVGWLDDVYQIFRSNEQGGIVVAAQNDSGAERNYKVVLSIGLDSQDTMSSAMDQIRSIVASSAKIADLSRATEQITASLDLAAAVKSNEEWIDSLSFCTWNGLGQDLTQSKIMNALEQLQKNNIYISTLLIDDNWQSVGDTKANQEIKDQFYAGFADMRANTSIAPNGLKDLIRDIRTKYPSIKDIGVWHALMGYWAGFSPYGTIAKQYPMTEIDAFLMGNKSAQIMTIAPDALHKFYDDFYSFLRDAGLTFVKTDVQHMLSVYHASETRRQLVSTYQSAWTCAHLKYFGGKVISCMSQTPQTLFHSLLQTSTPPVVHRNSDDFYPEVEASHPWHVWVNAHNAHFTRHLNAVLDWDMFQTDHEFSAYHAAARCVSGGPILITDIPGQHDVRLLDEMTARSPGGSSIALRTSPGVSNKVFNLYTEGSVLKVGAGTKSGSAVIAVFNVGEREVREMIHVAEFNLPGEPINEVLVKGHRTGEVFGPISLAPQSRATTAEGDRSEEEMKRLIHVRLAVRGWDILTAQPVQCIELTPGSHSKVCVLGLIGKMSGAAAITTSSISITEQKANIRVGLKALGKLGVWFNDAGYKGRVEARVQGSRVDTGHLNLVVLPQHQSGRSGDDIGQNAIGTDSATGDVLNMPHIWEIDVEAFWKQKAMWDETCKEVVVELLVG